MEERRRQVGHGRRLKAAALSVTLAAAGVVVAQQLAPSAGATSYGPAQIGTQNTGWEASSITQAGRGIGGRGVGLILDTQGGLHAWDGCLAFEGRWGVSPNGALWLRPVPTQVCSSIDAVSNAFGKAFENPHVSYEALDRVVVRNSKTTIVFRYAPHLAPMPTIPRVAPTPPPPTTTTTSLRDYGQLGGDRNAVTSRTLRVVSASLPSIGQAASLLALRVPNRPAPSFAHYVTLYSDGIGVASGVCGVVSFRWDRAAPSAGFYNVVWSPPARVCPTWASAADKDLATLLAGATVSSVDSTTEALAYNSPAGTFTLRP